MTDPDDRRPWEADEEEDGGRPPWDDLDDDDDEEEGAAAGPNGAGTATGTTGAGPGAGPAPGPATSGLPLIRVSGGSLPANVLEAEAALTVHAMEAPLEGVYQRGGILMRVHRVRKAAKDQQGVWRPEGAPVLMPVTSGFLQCHLGRVATWAKYDGRSKRDVLIDPPKTVVPPLLDGPWQVIQPLTGLLETPALMPNGRLLQGRGYDAETGLLLDTLAIPPIGRSRAAAEAALKLLLEVFVGFPYKSEIDRAVAVSAPLSLLSAPLLDATPAVCFDAPEAGSGKSLQAEATALIGLGRKPSAISQAHDEAEDKKRLFSILLKGDSMALIDNIAKPLESDALCAIITSSEYEDRILGASRMVVLPARTLWVFTGNNIRIVGDLIRRTLISGIDPKCERPELRSFKVNLKEMIPRRRIELVHACLTIMSSYIAAGRPKPLAPFGNFEVWSQLVREPLVWLGLPDPCDSYERLADDDPERETLGALMDAWWTCFKDKKMTIKQVWAEASTGTTVEKTTLRDAITSAVVVKQGGRGEPNQWLGFYLRSKADRVHKGKHFTREKNDISANAAVWQLKKLDDY